MPIIAPYIKRAIEADPTIFDKAMQEQFKKLIMEPFSKIPPGSRTITTLVIVIDALDECEGDADIKLIINILSHAKALLFPRFRIFVTSRPELPIRLGFDAIKGTYQDMALHEIHESIVEHDLTAFLEHEIAKIKNSYNDSVLEDRQLPNDWPGQTNIQTLVKMAIPLFIFAATVCRFLEDRKCGNPSKKLQKILAYQIGNDVSQLNATYMPVLDAQLTDLSDRQKDEVLQEFREVVGSIVILASPLSTHALAHLLDVPKETIDDRLDLLHSVLSVPQLSDSPVRLLHLSFRDFLVNPENRKGNQFWVDEKETHQRLATHCLQVMEECLRTDICALNDPGIFHAVINSQKIDACLLPEVKYACLYWVYHVQQTELCSNDGREVYTFLTHHFLHWMEALSLMGRASESLSMIKTLQSHIEV